MKIITQEVELEMVADVLRDIPDFDTILSAIGTAKADFVLWEDQTNIWLNSAAAAIMQQPFAGLKFNGTNSVINAGNYAL